MKRLWMISNFASGSATEEKCEAIKAIMKERGLVLVRSTAFPAEPMPEIAELEEEQVDTLVLFAGDGTINAAALRYDKWRGQALIIPGGTMNVLAKRLHGNAEPADIVHAAHENPRVRTVPFVESGEHRAYCALIVGPAAAWAGAREAARYHKVRRFFRALRVAWGRTWSRGVSLFDGRKKRGNYKALLIAPEDGWLRITAFSMATFTDALRLGWEWLWGNVHNAPTVDDTRSAHVTVDARRRTLHALFDGEEAKLQAPARISAGTSNLKFVATVETP